jgi:zinc protease
LFVTATCLREDFATAWAIYADIIMSPSFPETELDQTRRLMLAALAGRDDDVGAEASQLFRDTFFTISPYRLAPEGSARTLAHVQRQDVIAFQQRYVVPNNMVLAIFGDIDLAATAAAVEQTFASFAPQPLQFPTVPAEPFPSEERRRVKQTQKQVAAIYIGFPGTTLANVTDRYPLHILDAILSGIQLPGGWLHEELRGRQLVYSVHAFNWLGLEPGYFGIYAVTQPPQVAQVITLIRQQLEKAKTGTITDEELAQAKQMAIVSAQLERQTNEQLASDAALHELYGLGYDFSEQEQTQLEQVTKADVQRVAQAYLRHPTIVVTTPEPQAR